MPLDMLTMLKNVYAEHEWALVSGAGRTARRKSGRPTSGCTLLRAGTELVIGYCKADHRLGRSFYKGFFGDSINVILAAAAFNFKRAMRLLLYFIIWCSGKQGLNSQHQFIPQVYMKKCDVAFLRIDSLDKRIIAPLSLTR